LELHFYKYHGTGNDFVIFDGRDQDVHSLLTQDIIATICHRRFGVGADGIMILENHHVEDFNMVYYNADGRPSSMCGNGGRCLVAFAEKMEVFRDECSFMASDGLHKATIKDGWVELKMIDVDNLEYDGLDCILDTGSPHYITACEVLDNLEITPAAHAIRYNERFKQEGINVNFLQQMKEGIRIRTYERGVEDETWACGTGATAAAIAFAHQNNLLGVQEIPVKVEGGNLSVKLERVEDSFKNVWLCGPAAFVFEGSIEV